jgi:hypothetical protein
MLSYKLEKYLDPQAREVYLYYVTALIFILIIVFGVRSGRRKSRMKLNLRAGKSSGHLDGPGKYPDNPYSPPESFGPWSGDVQNKGAEPIRFQKPAVERPLNVMFNYNGETWDAYEVLGLPAGSSLEKADEAFTAACAKVDPSSRGFIEAAHRAVVAQWRTYQKASGA